LNENSQTALKKKRIKGERKEEEEE